MFLCKGQVHVLLRPDQPQDGVREHNVPQDGAPVLAGRPRLIQLVVHSGKKITINKNMTRLVCISVVAESNPEILNEAAIISKFCPPLSYNY